MTRPGRKASRPDSVPPEAQARARFEHDLDEYATGLNDRLASALDVKASPDQVFAAIDWDGEEDRLKPIILRHIYQLAQVGAWDILDEWNPDADGWAAENLLAYLDKAAATNAARMVDGRRTQLADPGKLEDFDEKLRDALTATGWAAVWAATFGTEAIGFGRHDAAQATGLGNKTWHTTSTNPRPSHAAQNGETVAADDIFSNGLRWPGDHFGDPEETVNCSCTVTYNR